MRNGRAEPEDGDRVEPLPVLHQLVKRPHALRDHHIAFVEPRDLGKEIKIVNSQAIKTLIHLFTFYINKKTYYYRILGEQKCHF